MPQVETQIADLTKQIESVEAAITAVHIGQSYSIGGRTLTRADVSSLRDERTRLIRERKQARAVMQGAQNPGITVATWYR